MGLVRTLLRKDDDEVEVNVPESIATCIAYNVDDLEPFICLQICLGRKNVNVALSDEDADSLVNILHKAKERLQEVQGRPA